MDIVELLKRDPCSDRDHCYQSEQFCQCAIQHKAADEIDRLREALQEIANLEEISVGDFRFNFWRHQQIARAALKGDE